MTMKTYRKEGFGALWFQKNKLISTDKHGSRKLKVSVFNKYEETVNDKQL